MGIEIAPRHKLFGIDHLRAFDVERLQFLGGERDEMASYTRLLLLTVPTRERVLP